MTSNPDKARVIETLIQKLESEYSTLTRAAKAAYEAATHDESKAEDSHDTRGLEASYLAGAQAQRAAEIQGQITQLKYLDLRTTPRIGLGSLVTVAMPDGRMTQYLLVSGGAGITLTVVDFRIQVITPRSPMGEVMSGLRAGDAFELETPQGVREFEVVRFE